MILVNLKAYIQKHHAVSLFELTQAFGVQADALRPMLNIWINKGVISKANKTPQCGSRCLKCEPTLTEMYTA